MKKEREMEVTMKIQVREEAARKIRVDTITLDHLHQNVSY